MKEMHGAVWRGLVLVVLVACTDPGARSLTGEPSSPDSVRTTDQAERALPRPNATIPESAEGLAGELESTTPALLAAIDRWADDSGLVTAPPHDVRVLALHDYRLTSALTQDPKLLDATAAILPRGLARQVRVDATAGAKIRSLIAPIEGEGTLRIQQAEPAGALRGYYTAAQERFGVDWEVLAALNFVESRFGRARSPSPAGARGPMQFVPPTWKAYGMGGDIEDPHDAILGAANFLHTSGAPERYRRPLYYYNHSWEYVDAVLLYARQITRDPRNWLAYYNWPVVVVTTNGELRLTGPGSS